MAFVSTAKVELWLQRFVAGELNPAQAPAWMQPLLTKQTTNIDGLADMAVAGAKQVSRFGLEGLRYNARLSELVGESQELATAIEETSATAAEIERYASTVLDRAELSQKQAIDGQSTLSALVEKLSHIENSITRVGEQASAFVEKTNNIIKLTSTVNEIADQTNLLALNAAIEAARAGEHGRGFSVVADEVRGLAHRSADAAGEIESIVSDVVVGAKEIDTIIEASVESLSASQADRKELTQAITQAEQAARDNVEAATQVAAAASQQASVAGEMAERVNGLDGSTRESAEIFTRIADSIASLRDTQYAMLKEFDASNSKMLLRLAKSDHIVWVDKVIRFALFGEQSLSEHELKSHLECRLGKFIASDSGQAYAEHPRFDFMVNDAHPKVHQTGIEIYRMANARADKSELEQQVEALLSYSDQVIGVLDELILD